MESAITELDHLQIPLQKILDATNNFSDKNIIGKGGFGKVYRGKLEHHGKMIKIAARRLDRKSGHGDVEFWSEVSTLSSFRKWNIFVVHMIGFCDEKGEKIVINHHYSKGSLSQYISDPLTLNVYLRLGIAKRVCWAVDGIHTELKGNNIMHRNINSSTILLNYKWKPRLSGFEYSIKHSKERRNQVLNSEAIGTQGYIDPAIEKYGGVNHKSDIYSFGVVLFELLCGRKALEENMLLAPLAKFHYENGTLKDIIHPHIWNQMNPKSFECFSEAAYSCLHEDPALRPEARTLWMQLRKANTLQKKNDGMEEKHPIFENLLDKSSLDLLDLWKKNRKDTLEFSLEDIRSRGENFSDTNSNIEKGYVMATFMKEFEDLKIQLEEIKSATYNFDRTKVIGSGGFGKVYEGELSHFKGKSLVAVKRLDRKFGQGDPEFWKEVMMLSRYSHKNLISLLGFCDEAGEKILVYEYASNGSLDRHLSSNAFTWSQRIKICLDAARGLCYLHDDKGTHQRVLHRDIKSSNILLDEKWNAKISDLGLSKLGPANQQHTALVTGIVGTLGYLDPIYLQMGVLTKESDVYSFGVVLMEVLCGKLCFEKNINGTSPTLVQTWRKSCKTGQLDEIVFQDVMQPLHPDSLHTFSKIALQCLNKYRERRPLMSLVVKELETSLKLQEPHDFKLPKKYEGMRDETTPATGSVG